MAPLRCTNWFMPARRVSAKKTATSPKAARRSGASARIPQCGLVMPISATEDCPAKHWDDVREILFESVDKAGFSAQMVSDADEVGVIHKRIVQNLYVNDIVVCDLSAKNPNVMFELGLRLAFDKPTVLVIDDKTSFSFDTSPIEHLRYPRDLRYASILTFKKNLTTKIKRTHEVAQQDGDYSPFLKHFGTFTVPKLSEREASPEAAAIEQLQEEFRTLRKVLLMGNAPHAAPSGGLDTRIRDAALWLHDTVRAHGHMGRENATKMLKVRLGPLYKSQLEAELAAKRAYSLWLHRLRRQEQQLAIF